MLAFAGMESSRLIVALAVFGLTLGLWLAVVIVWRIKKTRHADRILERLGMVKEDDSSAELTRVLRLWHDSREATLVVPEPPSQAGLLKRLDELCKEAGWKVPSRLLLVAAVMTSVMVFVLVLVFTDRMLAGVSGLIVTLILFWTYLNRRVNKRREFFDIQFTDALDLACRSLRAGHPLMGALRLVAEEVGEPVGPLFASICQQHMMGVPLEQAIESVSKASCSEDMKLFSASLSMQMRSGGNLAHMMERLAMVIRDRIRLSRRVRILTAQTQFGKRILVALPFVMMVVLSILNPRYIEPLYTTVAGQIMLVIGGISVLLGMWTMNRMAILRY